MPAAILYNNLTSTLLPLATPAAIDTAPASNLVDPQPRLRAAWSGTTVSLVYDLGVLTSIEAVALISTTIAAAATVRARLSVADATGETGDAWDSGVVTADTSDLAGGNVILLRPYAAALAAGRYLRVDIVDATAGRIDMGRVVAGPLWRIAAGASLGGREGRLILDQRDRNPLTGAEFALPAIANPRMANITLPLLTRTEAAGAARTMLDNIGAAGDVLWVPETTLGQPELNRRCIWGAAARGGEDVVIEQRTQTRHLRTLRLVERL
ncbi:MAG: hypothetical protein V4653_15380 [Pseudomonadota bacterium]